MEIKLLSCPLCLKPHFHDVDDLRSSLIAVATTQLTCPVCSETLLGLDKLTIHLFTHINEENKIKDDASSTLDITPDASFTTTTADAIIDSSKTEEEINQSIEHEKSLGNEDDENSIKCDICNFTFTDKALLEMHQKLLHQTLPDKNTGVYSYHCHLCSKKFKKRGSLMVHLRVAHFGYGGGPQTPPPPEAIVGSPEAPSPTQVKDSNKQWECDVCTKMFTTKYFLKKHKRLHTGEMPYFCAQCNKSFTFQQSYHKHMLYHSSEKPYVCNECGRAFKELSTLQNHARIHSGERPFGCETCGKRFRQRVSYLVHQRIHTGVMPYKCTACDKNFRYKVSQRSHKCPMNPPGSVIRISESSDKAIKQESPTIPTSTAEPKCIMSVDYNTGNINFIQEKDINNPKIEVMYLENTCIPPVPEKPLDDRISNEFLTETPDLYSMVLSPLLPEVESLCLTNSPPLIKQNDDNIHLINDESLKELLYGNK